MGINHAAALPLKIKVSLERKPARRSRARPLRGNTDLRVICRASNGSATRNYPLLMRRRLMRAKGALGERITGGVVRSLKCPFARLDEARA